MAARETFEDTIIDRKPRKILSPEENRRVASLLKIYRETRSDDASQDREIAASALDEIDPRIMENERLREAAAERQAFDRTVDDMISEHEQQRSPNR